MAVGEGTIFPIKNSSVASLEAAEVTAEKNWVVTEEIIAEAPGRSDDGTVC